MSAGRKLLLVDDDAMFRRVLSGELERRGFEVVAVDSGAGAIEAANGHSPEIVLLDLRLPDMDGLDVLRVIREKNPGCEVIMLTGHGSIDTAIEAIRIGAFDYVAKPCPLDELEVRMQRALEKSSLRRRAELLERGLTPPDPKPSFIGESPAFRRTLELIERVALGDSSVLFCGETGSGKEVAAKMLHAQSPRAKRPFIVVDCAALQEGLLQSELFGHERGAFTGADRAKHGLFEVADGGTIFLDEIGDVSQATQVKLLRVLDGSTFRHVGGTAEIRVDVRVLAATNRDLQSMVEQGLFREDLYYRLSAIVIELPPLRERQGDVSLLAQHFTRRINERYGFRKSMGDEALAFLNRHAWPGNVRELLHAVEAAALICDGPQILPSHLLSSLRTNSSTTSDHGADAESLPSLREMERKLIERVLDATDGHRGKSARILGISERNLYRKLRDHRLLS